MRLHLGVALIVGLIRGSLLGEQVEARQATPEEAGQEEMVEFPSPMLLEISLGASGERKSLARGGLDLEVTPTLTSGWPRQDFDVTVALVAAGKEIRKKTWDDLTAGADDSIANKVLRALAAGGLRGQGDEASERRVFIQADLRAGERTG